MVTQSLVLTLEIAFIATLINIPLSFMSSIVITRSKHKSLKFVTDIIISLPLVLPPVVLGYFLLIIFSPAGFVGQILEEIGIEIVFTKFAAILACALVSFPLMARSFIIALESVDRDLEKVARSLGSSNIKMFFTITLRESFFGISGGILLGFARALGEFGATIIFAGNIEGVSRTIPLAIFQSIQTGDDQNLSILILCSVVLGIFSVVINNILIYKSKKT